MSTNSATTPTATSLAPASTPSTMCPALWACIETVAQHLKTRS